MPKSKKASGGEIVKVEGDIKSDVVKTVRIMVSEQKKVTSIAGRAYYNFILKSIIEDISGDPTFMEYILGQIMTRVKSNADELFNIRVVKLIKKEIESMFRDSILTMMSNKKVQLEDYVAELEEKEAKK